MSLTINALGALEISVVVSVFLLGAVTVQTCDYFVRFRNDRLSLKLLIAALWVLEMLHAGCVVYYLYSATITLSIRPGEMDSDPTSIVLALAGHGCSNALLQIALTRRLYIITERLTVPIILWSLTALSFSGFVISMVFLLSSRQIQWGIATTCFLLLDATIYFAISAAIYQSLRTSRKHKSRSTQRLIRRLMIWTLVNGFIFSAAGIISAILFIVRVDSILWIGVVSVSQQFFSVSFLASLNARKGLRNIAHTDAEPLATKMTSPLKFTQTVHGTSTSGQVSVESYGMGRHSAGFRASSVETRTHSITLPSEAVVPS